MGRLIKYTLSIVAALSLSCCYDSFEGGVSTIDDDTPTPNITIEALAAMLQTERMTIYDDLVIQGSVTSTDRNGNFYKTFVIESGGYGIEILEGLYDSYVRHDVGSVVSVRLQGLALSTSRGVLQAGLVASEGSYYMLDYLSLESVIDEHIFVNYTYEELTPHVVTIDELTEEMCGRLVQIESLVHSPNEGELQPYTWGSYQQFVNNSDDSVWCYTSDYANFSLLAIPQATITLRGILQRDDISGVSGGEQYILEMRGVEDCVEE